MGAYRRVAVPQFLVALSQLGLTGAAVCLCGIEIPPMLMGLCIGQTCSYFGEGFHGYPIPWRGHTVHGWSQIGNPTMHLDEPEYQGCNWAVPAAMVVLAWSLPPVVASHLAGFRRWLKGESWPTISRTSRWLQVLALALLCGLVTSLIDVLTGPGFCCCYVLFSHPPGAWVDHSEVSDAMWWLSRQRREFGPWPHDPYDECEVWADRTRLTLTAIGLGVPFGCLIFRPWRRAGGPSASDGAAATTPPSA
jgi:hypothetical protein